MYVPSLSPEVITPSGDTAMPLGARRPVATVSMREPSLLTFRIAPWCGTIFMKPRPPGFTGAPLLK
jgi:hypothetical protein